MSSMIKKKGALAKTFKPKAPQARRPPGAPPSAASSARPSVEPQSQSQTPASTALADVVPTFSARPVIHDLTDSSPLHPVEVEAAPQPEANVTETTISQDATATIPEIILKRKADAEKQTSSKESTLQPPAKKSRTLPPLSQSDSVGQWQDPAPQRGLDQQAQPAEAQTSQVQSAEVLIDPLTSIESLQAPPSATLPPTLDQNDPPEQPRPATIAHTTNDLQQPDTPMLGPAPEASASQSTTRESTQESQSEVEIDLSAMGPGQSNRRSHIVPSATLNPDGTSGVTHREVESAATPEKGKKRAPKRKKIQPQEGDVRATIEIQLHRPKRAAGEKRSRKKKEGERKKRRRAPTPEGAEDEPLPVGITMGDLCKDLRIGKKFSKHDEIRQKDNQRKIEAKLAKTHPELIPPGSGEAARDGGEGGSGGSAQEEAPRPPNTTIQMKIVDGNIVLDDNSLRYDAHKEANSSGQVQEVVEENEFTKLLTSGSYMKKVRAIQWTTMDTELFYKCLRSYGTDFQMIATHFPGRNRKQIKLKFNTEDREFPARITKALSGTPEPIDVEEHQARAGIRYEDVADIEAAARAEVEKHEAEQAAELAKQAENTARKKAEIQARAGITGREGDSSKENEPEGADGEASAASKFKKKGTVKKPKNKHSIRGGGEEVEVVGTVEY